MAHDARQLAFVVSFAALLSLAAIPPARAKESSLDSAAARIADGVSQSKLKSVAVFDFVGPRNNQLTALGQKLADDFSAALAKSNQKLEILDRTRIATAISNDNLAPAAMLISETQLYLAQELSVDAFVVGTFRAEGEDLKINVRCLRRESAETLAAVDILLVLTEEEKELLAKRTDDDPFAKYAASGSHGVSSAACLYCPRADYPDAALKHRIVGEVRLEAVVDIDGRVKEIRVLKPLPYGLTQSAIEAVQSWRLTPAKGPDGNPVAVREELELTFQVFP
jgi:TonB family protein